MGAFGDSLMDMGSGAGSGASLGPEGALIGAGLGLATGLIQNISAAKSKKKADAAMPPLIDPRQAAFLSELNQKRKAIDTGADFGASMGAIGNTNAATNNAIVKATGGDVGGTIQGLLQSQAVANAGTNNALAQGQGEQLAYNSMFNDLNNKISAKTMQLQLLDSQQSRAEWAQKKQMANQNLMAGASGALGALMTPKQNSGGAFFGGESVPPINSYLTHPALTTATNPDDLNLAVDTSFLYK